MSETRVGTGCLRADDCVCDGRQIVPGRHRAVPCPGPTAEERARILGRRERRDVESLTPAPTPVAPADAQATPIGIDGVCAACGAQVADVRTHPCADPRVAVPALCDKLRAVEAERDAARSERDELLHAIGRAVFPELNAQPSRQVYPWVKTGVAEIERMARERDLLTETARWLTEQRDAARSALREEFSAEDREEMGKIVRDVWIAWAREQPNPKASWLVPWDRLSEPEREVDRRIGETVAGLARGEMREKLRAVDAERDRQAGVIASLDAGLAAGLRQVDDLRSQLAAAQRALGEERARLDWLEVHPLDAVVVGAFTDGALGLERGHVCELRWMYQHQPMPLRDAIDAARRAAPAGTFYECPDCLFRFDAVHTNADGGHSCPACSEAAAERELAQLRTRVAAAEAALREIADRRRLHDPCGDSESWQEMALCIQMLARDAVRAAPAGGMEG